MDEVDKLTVSLIRTFNNGDPEVRRARDEELMWRYGSVAQPLADAIRETIREEIRRG